MDMSFSGILSYMEDVIELFPHLKLPDPVEGDVEEEMERRKRKKNKQVNRQKLKEKLP